MAVPKLFTWIPSQSSAIDIEPRVRSVKFGDGYEQRSRDGINNRPLQLKMRFRKRSQKVANQILSFLDSLDGVETFRFVPPAPYSYPRRFYCKKHGPDYDEPNVVSIDADFIESFEPMDVTGDYEVWSGIYISPQISWSGVPATSTGAGSKGQMAFDDRYLYCCVDTDVWKRTPIHVTSQPIGLLDTPSVGYNVYTLDWFYIMTDTSTWRRFPFLTTPFPPTEFSNPIISEPQLNSNYFFIKIAPDLWKRRYIMTW